VAEAVMEGIVYTCKWDRYRDVSHYWHQYILLVKRGGSPLILCPPYLYDVAECELQAEAHIAKKKKSKEIQNNILREKDKK
jgi:hypothetical protein